MGCGEKRGFFGFISDIVAYLYVGRNDLGDSG